MDTLLLSDSGTRRRRRYHSPEFKARLIAACQQPGISMAAIALTHQVNANLLRRWVREAEQAASSLSPVASSDQVAVSQPSSPAFVPVRLTEAFSAEPIRLELCTGTIQVNIAWPSAQAEACALWLRELLR